MAEIASGLRYDEDRWFDGIEKKLDGFVNAYSGLSFEIKKLGNI